MYRKIMIKKDDNTSQDGEQAKFMKCVWNNKADSHETNNINEVTIHLKQHKTLNSGYIC